MTAPVLIKQNYIFTKTIPDHYRPRQKFNIISCLYFHLFILEVRVLHPLTTC